MTKLTALQRYLIEADPGYQRARQAADDFTASMDRLIHEAGATPAQIDQLKAAVEQMGTVGGVRRSHAADVLGDYFKGIRQHEEHWAQLLPDVAARGNDAPHVSVRHMPGGDLVWSWFAKGHRVYRQAAA